MSEIDDREFATRAMARLQAVTPPPGLNQRLLAAYEARMRHGTRLSRLAELVWPGAPGWATGAALAMALLLGLGIGAVLPAPVQADRPLLSLDQPPGFSVESLLAEPR